MIDTENHIAPGEEPVAVTGEPTESSGFETLCRMPELLHALEAMGFTQPTDIQAQAIPLLRDGADIIARSQTGTGKTMAFAIPAVEMIDRAQAEPTVQVLILCPTRELAQQGCEEIRKLIRYTLNVWPVDIYGGAAMDRQILRLRRANLVIGTPGRVMDHMRRGTLSLEHVKLVVLDEADEMLSMGFREDIETILKDVPEARQTAMFSATMPQPILELTDRYMRDPQLIEVDRAHITLDAIHQMFMSAPMGRKLDALNLFLRYYEPVRAMIFCNTRLMVDEVSAYLNRNGFTCEGIHGDMNQSQRTRVMEGFKSARIPILAATDVAARGIDVNDIDYVINYDVPQNSEIYVHRIGRTGRAGKTGNAVTLCCGRRQFFGIRDIERATHSQVEEIPIPTVAGILEKQCEKNLEQLRAALDGELLPEFQTIVGKLMAEGREPALIATAAVQLCFRREETGLADIVAERRADGGRLYRKLILGIGRRQRVAPNHIVSAIAGRAGIPGGEIGKIEIYDEKTVVGIPAERAEAVERALHGVEICGHSVRVKLSDERPAARPTGARPDRSLGPRDTRRAYAGASHQDEADGAAPDPARQRGRVRLSPAARARLLDGSDLSRFELPGSDRQNRSRPARPDSRRGNRSDGRRDNRRKPDRDFRRKHR